jgi:hypothetical protein
VLDGPIVDVAIGLIFFYVVLSLICSAVQELVASVFGLRSSNLNKGIHNLLGDEHADKIFNHPLIKHLAKHGKSPPTFGPRSSQRRCWMSSASGRMKMTRQR